MPMPDAPLAPTDPATVFAWSAARFAGTAAAALFGLDAALGQVIRTTREPLVGQMRLTWWHDALTALDHAPPPAQPVLVDLAAVALPHVTGARMAAMVDAWEALLDTPDDDALALYAQARGGELFAMLGACAGGVMPPEMASAGEGWALADLASHVSDAGLRERAARLAAARFAAADVRWPRASRAVGGVAVDAAGALAGRSVPARAAAVLRFRLTGRSPLFSAILAR
jgi:phytoene synthase